MHPGEIRSVYFIGICGTGMASLAAMFKQRGYRVEGSDENVYPPMSTFLQEQQIPIHHGFHARHLQPPPDLVIIGNAMTRGNPEVEYVLNEKLYYTSLPAALCDFFIRGRYSCVVTGTHGKTTTASMLAWVLQNAGKQPGFFIGGIPENFGRGYQLGEGRIFVVEGDEYDSAFFDKGAKFLHYLPDLVIINNVEYDHADIYADLEEIKTAFHRLIRIVPGNGYIVANYDDETVRELLNTAYSRLCFFGRHPEAEWHYENVVHSESETQFDVLHRGEKVARLSIRLAGEHNIRNALAVFAAGTMLGVPQQELLDGLKTFRGVRRRLTRIGEIGQILVLDDFAHHATAVRETIRAVRQRYPHRRLWAIFEPRTASAKRKVFESQYYRAFDEADQVILAPLHRPDKVPEPERLSVQRVVEQIRKRGIQAQVLEPGEGMLRFLCENARAGDIFLFMSNGNFSDMPGQFWKELNHKRAES